MSPRPAPPADVDRAAAGRAAIAARRARAAVKHEISTRQRTALDAAQAGWNDPESPEASLRVTELLGSVPSLGPTRTARIMAELEISDRKRVGGLGIRQRSKLRDWLVQRQGAEPSRLLVLAGPTAVGKGTVSTYIRDNYPEVVLSVSATTRTPRPGEIDGVHYYFVSDEEFDRFIAAGELLEWAEVHEHRYGTPGAPIAAARAAGRLAVVDIDPQGARQLRLAVPDAIVVLLTAGWESEVVNLIGPPAGAR